MLARLIALSLRFRWGVIALWLAVVVIGAVSFLHLPIDAFPDTTPVQVQINTTVPALGPLEVERQVSFPIEQAIGGLPRLTEVRSISKFGQSQVIVLFEDGTDIQIARMQVSERLRSVVLPPGVPPPLLGPVTTGLGEIVHYRLEGGGRTLAELRTIHDWIVRPQLRSVAGVAEVNSWGGEERQVHVILSPERLVKYALAFHDVFDALERNNRNAGGGLIEIGEAQIVQGIGVLTTIEQIGGIVVAARDGVPIRVRDVAEVREGAAIRLGAVTAEGEGESVLGLAFMLSGENSHEVAGRIRERLRDVEASLPEGVRIVPLYDRTHLVEEVLATVRENLFEGALLVVAILFAFLGSVRAGLIVASAIPLSLLFAGSVMARTGIAGSLMSLGAIDFGLIVDSSVILVENAARRLREDRGAHETEEVVRDAAVEVRRPTLFGELIILIVYLPILTLQGIEGKLFRPMALTIVFALFASMLLSLTLMPALCAVFLRSGGSTREPLLVRALQRLYAPVLAWALRRRSTVLVAAGLVVLAGGALALGRGAVFIPRLSEGSIVVNVVRATGVTLEESTRLSTQIERALKERFPDEIARIWSRTGTAEVATDIMGIELTDVFLMLKDRGEWRKARTQEELVEAIEAELIDLPGIRMVFTQPIEMRMNEMVAGIRSDVAIKIFGDDLEMLRQKAAEIAEVVSGIDGAADVLAEQVTGQPMLEIRPDPLRLGRYGADAEDILSIVETIGGREAGEMREGEIRVPIAVRLAEPYRSDPDALSSVAVFTPVGGSVPLGQVARIARSEAPSTVTREWGKRRIVVQANVRGRDIASFVAEARSRVAEQVALPAGTYVRWGGQFEHLVRARNRLAIVVPVALLSILALLYATYGRWRDALRVFTGVPFAMVGGVLALAARGMPFSVSAGIGFVALSGVAVLGDMVLVSFIRQELARGVEIEEAVRRAAGQRLRPVLMTALVASLGFLPMAVNTGVGAEVQRPLATVVVGGVLFSALLTLIVLPALYLVFSRGRRPEEL